MSKNYKKRGYPGKELKKKKKGKGFLGHPPILESSLYPPIYNAVENIFEIDPDQERVRRLVNTLSAKVSSLQYELDDVRKQWKKDKKDKAIFKNKVSAMRKHIVAMTPRSEPMLKGTALSRVIRNM